jgi:hypothetical protein
LGRLRQREDVGREIRKDSGLHIFNSNKASWLDLPLEFDLKKEL